MDGRGPFLSAQECEQSEITASWFQRDSVMRRRPCSFTEWSLAFHMILASTFALGATGWDLELRFGIWSVFSVRSVQEVSNNWWGQELRQSYGGCRHVIKSIWIIRVTIFRRGPCKTQKHLQLLHPNRESELSQRVTGAAESWSYD